MVGRIFDLPGRIAISSRTFGISSGNQSGPDLSFLCSGDYNKVYQSGGLVTISTISPYLPLSRSDPHFPLSLDGYFSSALFPFSSLPPLILVFLSVSLFPSLFPHVITFLHVFEGAVEQKL